MIDVPAQIKNDYNKLLAQRGIPIHNHNFYQTWLRLYLDFCSKYHHDPVRRSSDPLFIRKLQEKNHTPRQQKQASHAINLYYTLENDDIIHDKV